MKNYDVVILGGGASGLFATASALKNKRSVAIIEMGNAQLAKSRCLVAGGVILQI